MIELMIGETVWVPSQAMLTYLNSMYSGFIFWIGWPYNERAFLVQLRIYQRQHRLHYTKVTVHEEAAPSTFH